MTPLDAAYAQQRRQLVAAVVAAAAAGWLQLREDRGAASSHAAATVTAGQSLMASLVAAYMAAKSAQAGYDTSTVSLDTSRYTISLLRRVSADIVYGRPFGAYAATLNSGGDATQALDAARAAVEKLAATDLQLAQTHAARDWMRQAPWIVGYRRVLNPPSCELCTAAATRTYRVADLSPIHEHCDCGVEPLFGHEPVASAGTTVRIEEDPEIGPRLMADSWSPVGPRLIEPPA